ncbi:hypothetical protein EDB85DRAFT_56044 [Lactarius pseudohatsudake]|nr:hypothetical protein EDB85DRAFT_56044 [Lactarius pseudohatsudake]
MPSLRSTKAVVLMAAVAPSLYRFSSFPFPIVCVFTFISGPSLFYGFWRGTLVSCLLPPVFHRLTDPHRLHAALFAILVYFVIFLLFITYIISALYNVLFPHCLSHLNEI